MGRGHTLLLILQTLECTFLTCTRENSQLVGCNTIRYMLELRRWCWYTVCTMFAPLSVPASDMESLGSCVVCAACWTLTPVVQYVWVLAWIPYVDPVRWRRPTYSQHVYCGLASVCILSMCSCAPLSCLEGSWACCPTSSAVPHRATSVSSSSTSIPHRATTTSAIIISASSSSTSICHNHEPTSAIIISVSSHH